MYASIFRPGLFNGRVAIVTGGGSGLGRCAAHELSALGAAIALIGRKPDKLDGVADELRAAGGTVRTWVCDIRDEEKVRATVGEIVAAFGRIDYLVNNAGGQFGSRAENISAKGWDAVVRTNLTGGFLMARECYLQYMRDARAGAIANIIADMWMGMPGMAHSGAARAGMLNLTETVAVEWAPIRVNAVAPGWIASSGLDHYPAEMTDHIRTLHEKVPVGRLGTESEVAAAITFLLSDAAAFISGSCIRVDGAVPNAKAVWGKLERRGQTPEFNGFHLARRPKVLGPAE